MHARSRKRSRRAAVLAAAFVLCVAGRASAATYTWNVGGGPWHDPASWSPNGVPGANDVAVLHDGLVELDADVTVGTLRFLSGYVYGTPTLTAEHFEWRRGTMQDLGLTVATGTASPITVQLRTATGACFEAVYSAPFRKHDEHTLQDKAD